jgi:hypothetical protein
MANIMDGDIIMDTVVGLCLGPFVKPEYTRHNMEILSEKLINLYAKMDTDRCSPESLHKTFNQIFAKVTGWKISDCSIHFSSVSQRHLQMVPRIIRNGVSDTM